MDTYYKDILNKIEQLIEQQEIKKAYVLLEEELSMPYIPKEYEEQLVAYHNQCKCEVAFQQKQQHNQAENMEELLKGSVAEQLAAVDLLKKLNIRSHLHMIKGYFMETPHPLVRSFLIEALIEQHITDEITLLHDGIEVTFIPCCIEKPLECDGAVIAVQYLKEWFENENPTFFMMCIESLIKELYLRLPWNIEEDEGELLALSIANYVYIASDDEKGWNAFIIEKALAQKCSFELLLNKHDVLL